jgi:hypothetical protein
VNVPLAAADLFVRVGRRVWRHLPERARKTLEDRFFFAVFQATRVENDAYGWRPDDGEQPPTPDPGHPGRTENP